MRQHACLRSLQTAARLHIRSCQIALQILLEAGLAGKGQICVTQPRRVVSGWSTLQNTCVTPSWVSHAIMMTDQYAVKGS